MGFTPCSDEMPLWGKLCFESQQEGFLQTFHGYKGNRTQQDDVTVIGFRPTKMAKWE